MTVTVYHTMLSSVYNCMLVLLTIHNGHRVKSPSSCPHALDTSLLVTPTDSSLMSIVRSRKVPKKTLTDVGSQPDCLIRNIKAIEMFSRSAVN